MKPFVIAEIGINHNGDIAIAKKLIDISKNAGCDAVKFQKRSIDIVYTKELLDSPRDSPWGKNQRNQKTGLEFGKKEYDIIDAYCKERKIEWFASAWDLESQMFLQQFNLKFNKVASAMLTYLPLLEVIAKEGKHTFISTGMSSFADIDRAVEIFRKHQCPFTLLHCVSTYPSEDNECNLLAMKEIRDRYKCDVGYSGHEKGILPSVLAVALGATVIERHITLDKKMYGSDQAASIDEPELQLMMQQIRAVPEILGNGIKSVSEKERGIAKKLRYFE
jgi:N-acetylneuraminate synthase